MIDLKKLQKEIYQNKLDKGFNVKDINMEFAYITEELGELIHAYRKNLPDIGEEIADITIYLIGLAEILGLDFEEELKNKVDKNRKRTYTRKNGKLERVGD